MSALFDFTSATREQLAPIWRAIAEEIGDDRFFTTRELDCLPGVLAPREQVLAFSSGLHEGNTWLIVLTDQRILLLDKGMLFGLKQASIELDRINAIESSTGIMFGKIRIGSNAKAYEISNVWKRTVTPFTNKVREAMAAKRDRRTMRAPGTEHQPPSPNPPAEPAPGSSRADEASRERLRRAGLL